MMKKIILILSIIFLVSGCTDYKELNQLSYITGIGYDYKDNLFTATYEVMDNRTENGSVVTHTYVVNGTGSTLYDANLKATRKLNKTPYYSHTQAIVLTTDIVNNKIHEVTDFIMRNPKLNEEFSLVLTDSDSPDKIFSSTTDLRPSASFYISSLINNNDYSKDYYIKVPYAIFFQKLMEKDLNPLVSVIKLKDDEILLDKLAIFNDDLESILVDYKYGGLYNLLIDNKSFYPIKALIDDDYIEASVSVNDYSLDVSNNDITLNIDASFEIKVSPEDVNLYDENDIDILEKAVKKELDKQYLDFLYSMQDNESDVIGIKKQYYIDYRHRNDDLWINAKCNVDSNVSVSRKGIIYNGIK